MLIGAALQCGQGRVVGDGVWMDLYLLDGASRAIGDRK